MSNDSYSPQWICFINGLEVPIITAATTATVNQLATAQITMPYSPFLSKLPKHTKLTLFSYDQSDRKEPKLEFDGTIQGISWRKDKTGANTALFLMAQTDGIIWSARKKFNFFLDNAYGVDRMLATAQESESQGVTAQNIIFDPTINTIAQAKGDGGKAATLFLTHVFDVGDDDEFNGHLNYVDCGCRIDTKSASLGVSSQSVNPNYYASYIEKYYERYKALFKVCRTPLPAKYITSFDFLRKFNVIMQMFSSTQGEVNFWNYATEISDQFMFEIYDVPDASSVTLTNSEINYINKDAKSSTVSKIIAEYIMKPKSPFGPVPLCNVIFPDQVLDKSFYKNFQAEVTRVNSAQMMLLIANPNAAGLGFNFYQGPHFAKNGNDYFSSYDVGDIPIHPKSTSFLHRSDYEEEFGVNSKLIQLPDMLTRMYATQKNYKPIQNMVNHEFLVAYSEKVSFSMQVTPNVEVVPGFSLLVLDENGEHLLAYCYGREKVWDKNGQQLINLKIMFPRPYDLDTTAIADIADPFDPEEYPESSVQDLKLLSKYIGSDFISPSDDIKAYSYSLMEEWDKCQRDTYQVKTNRKAYRTYTRYSEYMDFHETSGVYNVNQAFNKMPEELISNWDISVKAASMSALQYTYAENGYKNPQSTDSFNTASDGSTYPPHYNPIYDDLNSPGPIKVSPFISGIVNCHNRYLMQVGNSIT